MVGLLACQRRAKLARGVSTFFRDFPGVHALYVGQAPVNPLCSTAESFPTGIPIPPRQPSYLLPDGWLDPYPGLGCRGRPLEHFIPLAGPSSHWTVKRTK